MHYCSPGMCSCWHVQYHGNIGKHSSCLGLTVMCMQRIALRTSSDPFMRLCFRLIEELCSCCSQAKARDN